MNFSLKAAAAGAALVLGAASASASLYDISYTASFNQNVMGSPIGSSVFTLTAQVEGTLQGDGNTVNVTDVVNWTINGDTFTSSSFAGGGIGTFGPYFTTGTLSGTAVFTLDGSEIDFIAANDTTSNYIEFSINNSAVEYAAFAYYGTGAGTNEYGFAYGPSNPLNGSWSMTLANTGSPSVVPEPASALLMLAGVPLLAVARRRKASSQSAA